MTTPSYIIRGGISGRERLRMLARVMSPATEALFDRLGVASDAQCLDAGCGGGDVGFALARRVPNGNVVGIDLDETKLGLARTEATELGLDNVEFRAADITDPPSQEDLDRYDVVYARFLLTHLTDPARVLQHLCARLTPGGLLIAEDIDFSGHFCHPDSPALWRYVNWYTRSAQARGVDPNIGQRLPALLRECGLRTLGMHVVQPAGFEGEAKLITPVTLEAIADAVLATGLCAVEEIESTIDELYEFARQPGTVMSVPRVVQAWGRRPPLQ